VIVGHSERRHIFGETDAWVASKLRAAQRHSLTPIFCVGETLEQREAGHTASVIESQVHGALEGLGTAELSRIVVAYEPVWAIGTGKVASPAQAQEVHGQIRRWLAGAASDQVAAQVRILYGGSVKPDNIVALMREPDIDGALVGGASLNADDFARIVRFED
jgi:triosephosphate isomerase